MGAKRATTVLLGVLAWPAIASGSLPQQDGAVTLPDQANVRILGAASSNLAGIAVGSAGDVNGDGIGDVVVGAPGAAGSQTSSGNAYVVFGSRAPQDRTLSNFQLDPTVGFLINGVATNDNAGQAVAGAGDVNGDGYDDVVVGAPFSDVGGNTDNGAAYVVFGGPSPQTVDLNNGDMPATAGILIRGPLADHQETGYSVAGAGDVNGDGLDDVVVGSPLSAGSQTGSGNAYVVYGHKNTSTPYTVQLNNVALSASQGFLINGVATDDDAGLSVDGAGDVNSDGYADVIVGAPFTAANGTISGAAYVVYGHPTDAFADPTVNLSDSGAPSHGGVLIRGDVGDAAGISVAGAGDVNGDGRPDLVVGTYHSTGQNTDSGGAAVVFGKDSMGTITLSDSGLAAADGFLVRGLASSDEAGSAVSGAGDVNDDGFADVVIGAKDTSGGGTDAGAAYVVYGAQTRSSVDVSNTSMPPAIGFVIRGSVMNGWTGKSVGGGGDYNGDARPDVIVGAPLTPQGANAGTAYVVYGFAPASLAYSNLTATQGQAVAPLVPAFKIGAGAATFGVSPPLPAGLTLDALTGVITGTPTAAGTSAHVVAMTDLSGTVNAPLIVTVNPPPGGPGGGAGGDTTAPVISRASLSRKRFRVGRGTKIRFTLSEKAGVRFAITRVGKPKRRRGRTFGRSGLAAGRHTVAFSGRIGRRALKPGRYRLTLTATDAARNVGRPISLRFTIVR